MLNALIDIVNVSGSETSNLYQVVVVQIFDDQIAGVDGVAASDSRDSVTELRYWAFNVNFRPLMMANWLIPASRMGCMSAALL